MKYSWLIFLWIVTALPASSQVTCESLHTAGVLYNCFDIKYGKTKLFKADTAIVNRMKLKTFELKKVSELSETEKNELKQYKLEYAPEDTVIFYDWDVLHNGEIGYYGRAVGRVRINCADSIMTISKFLLRKGTTDDVSTRFKIFRMHENDFIFYDKDHPYMNINYFFKK